ncbi:MAG: hypothetical protein A3C47_01935 [Omnitrophica bacterium RIFCSPHIGHO2_02_FULL_51_18]|nr:MAG: hypothetical protein A3C47_01935 [Omnitrophica bacterium RIFCSPHIGHO2_02_FULL_51_18]
MTTVFPVEIQGFRENGKDPALPLLQGFTRDISAGGMCIEIKSAQHEIENLIRGPNAHVSLAIEPPFARHPIRAVARVAWFRKQGDWQPARYLIGVTYTRIDATAQRRLFKYAQRLVWVPRVMALAGLLMLAAIGFLFLNNQQLVLENKRLVDRMVEGAEKKSVVASELQELARKKSSLEKSLQKSQDRIKELESLITAYKDENLSQKKAFQKELESSLLAQRELAEKLKNLQGTAEKLQETYRSLEETEKLTATTALRHMVEWIRSHQNLRTGLVASFEGDAALEDWAFSYDQSLACQTYLLFNDPESAKRILSFYGSKAEKEDGAYYNAYHAGDGSPVERTVHVGPNLWIGIAALQYENKMKDGRFMGIAKSVADWVIRMQDEEGGLKGGPAVSWYSTEHNLDAYAFLQMMHRITGEAQYEAASKKVLAWVKKYAYSVKEKRMNRGKGDATIATDTFSWAIAAIGPETLQVIEFDPEAIIQFAEEHCEVSVSYKRSSGKTAAARGFDFAKAENIGRGGVISTEWTAQMIVTYQILSDYFKASGYPEKEAVYSQKANLYLNELQKLIITSPSRTGQGRGCLPYASIDNVDTGHGWRTPKGRRTGSVAGTAYGIFAWVGYNPFDLDNKKAVQ